MKTGLLGLTRKQTIFVLVTVRNSCKRWRTTCCRLLRAITSDVGNLWKYRGSPPLFRCYERNNSWGQIDKVRSPCSLTVGNSPWKRPVIMLPRSFPRFQQSEASFVVADISRWKQLSDVPCIISLLGLNHWSYITCQGSYYLKDVIVSFHYFVSTKY